MTTKTTSFPWWVYASVLATFLLALWNIVPRYQAENSNKAVAIFVEADVIESKGTASGLTFDESLEVLKEAGVNGVSFNEATLGQLESAGYLKFQTDHQGQIRIQINEELQGSPLLANFAPPLNDLVLNGEPTSLSLSVLQSSSVGFNIVQTQSTHEKGMLILGRFGNPNTLPEGYLNWLFDQAKKNHVFSILPSGSSIPGFKAESKEFRDRLKSEGIFYASAEFVKTAGNSGVLIDQPENVIKLHAAQSAELERMSQIAVTERYVKAFNERNCRMLLIRPIDPSSDLREFADEIKHLKNGIEKAGGAVKTPRPFDEPTVPLLQSLFLAMASLPAMIFTAFSLFARKSLQYLFAGGAILLALGIVAEPLKDFMLLGYTIGFTVLAYLWLIRHQKVHPVLQYLVISLISLAGGFQIAGQLIGLKYMIQADSFFGVKLQVFFPILIIGFLLVSQIRPLRDIQKDPITWGGLSLGVIGMGVLGFMMLRTGNDNPAAVSGLELQFRNLLERVLPVRPRTKEFMIGHPALVVGLGLLAQQKTGSWNPMTVIFLSLSVIAQTSVVNTLCHLHTPISLSLVRIMTGHVCGCIIGLLLWGLFRLAQRFTKGRELVHGS